MVRNRKTKLTLGLFLDVDATLTEGIIQREFSKALGCEKEFNLIQKDLEEEHNADLFGKRLISLFSEYGLTRSKARAIAETIRLQKGAEKLLTANVSKYLISSGPNYYIYWLANKFQIPRRNVICSNYIFDKNTQVISRCNAASPQTKSNFTEKKAKRHNLTIGVGDHHRDDLPFLSKMTLPIIIENEQTINCSHLLKATTLDPIVNLLEALSKSNA
jgi:phosphoserine phosphatase